MVPLTEDGAAGSDGHGDELHGELLYRRGWERREDRIRLQELDPGDWNLSPRIDRPQPARQQ